MPELPAVAPGEVIDSTTFGNPVVERVVSRYADATARAAASPTPSAGEMSYLEDTKAVEVFDGSGWIPSATWNYAAVLAVGATTGFWWRPDPADTTKDWRIVPSAGGLVIQSRAGGTFGTVITIDDDGDMVASKSTETGFAGHFRNIHWGTTTPPSPALGDDDDLYIASPANNVPTVVWLKSNGIWRGA